MPVLPGILETKPGRGGLDIDADPVLDAVFDPDNYMEIQLLLE